ncbi:hypothetical protein Zm00014a_030518, partial [Zea mays]
TTATTKSFSPKQVRVG